MFNYYILLLKKTAHTLIVMAAEGLASILREHKITGVTG